MAVAEAEDAVAAAGELKVVGYEDAGESVFAVEALEEGEDAFGGLGVEIAGGFVGQQEFGLGDEGAGYGEALLFPAGELAGAMVAAVGQFDACEPCGGFGEGLLAVDAAREKRHGYVFEGGELGEEVVELPDVADVAVAVVAGLFGGEGGDVDVAAEDFAGGGFVECGEKVEEGAFAGAGLADDGDHLAGGYFEGEVAEELEAGCAGG